MKLTSCLMVIAATTLFGACGTLSRLLIDDGVSPVTLVEFRMAGGFATLAAFLVLARRDLIRFPLRQAGSLMLFGLTLALVIYFYFMAIARLPLAVALVVQFSAPVWMTIGTAVRRRAWPSAATWLALGLTIAGVCLMTGLWTRSFAELDPMGLVYALLTMLSYIVYLMAGRRAGHTVHALSSTTFGALIAAAFWLAIQPPWALPASTWAPQTLIPLALIGVAGMAIPFALIVAALRRITPAQVGMLSTFEIVSTSVIAFLWLGQALTVWQMCGCLLVIGGIAVCVVYPPSRQTERTHPELPVRAGQDLAHTT